MIPDKETGLEDIACIPDAFLSHQTCKSIRRRNNSHFLWILSNSQSADEVRANPDACRNPLHQ